MGELTLWPPTPEVVEDEERSLRLLDLIPWAFLVLDLLVVAAFLFRTQAQTPVPATDLLTALPAAALFLAAGAFVLVLARQQRTLYWLAFAVRAVVAVGMAFWAHFDDEVVFHVAAKSGNGAAYGGYGRVLNGLYRVFGPNLIVAKTLNVAIGALLVVLVGLLVADRRGQRTAGLLALGAPPLVIYAATNLKETSTAMLVLLALAAAVFLWQGRWSSKRAMLVGAAAVVALWWLRGPPWAAICLMAVGLGIVSETAVRRRLPPRRRALLLAVVVVGTVLIGPALSQEIAKNYVSVRTAHGATYFNERAFAANAGVTSYLKPGASLGPRNLAVLWGRGQFVPSPMTFFEKLTTINAITAIGSLGWYVVLVLGVWGAARAIHLPGAVTLVVAALVLSFATGSLVGLGADPVRHRVIVVPVLLVLAGMGSTVPGRLRASGWAILSSLVAGAMLYNGLWAWRFIVP